MPNIKDKLREEWKKTYAYRKGDNLAQLLNDAGEYWLSKLDSLLKEQSLDKQIDKWNTEAESLMNGEEQSKEEVKPTHSWNSIAVDDLLEDCALEMDNGLKLKYIGQVDTRSNQEYLFKTLYSPFATSKWIALTPERVAKLKVISLVKISSTSKVSEDWEKEFDNKFVEWHDDYRPHIREYKDREQSVVLDIKSFISSLLQRERAELEAIRDKMLNGYYVNAVEMLEKLLNKS